MRTRRDKFIHSESRHSDRWLLSYADLMTLLLALFIVMYAASDHERAQKVAAAFAGENTGGSGILPGNETNSDNKDEFTRRLLENPILIQKAKMRQTDRGLIVSLSEAAFFAPGEAVVNSEADGAIDALADSLKETNMPIRVEGHTDSTPISNSRYPSNWELSTARASSVLIRLIERGIAPERLSAAGYGGFQPVVDNSTPANRAQNRRVDVVILNR